MESKEKTPNILKPQDKETSAYRSYQRRENNRPSYIDAAQTEALEKFSTIVDLVNTKKLTKINAFENRIIDLVAEIFKGLEKNNKDPETVWQKYSTGVDSCAVIYGFCVDFLHSETYKILGGLSRAGNQEAEMDIDNQDEELKQKKKKKPHGGIATLEKDIQAITTTKFDKSEESDTYFKFISSNFDTSSTSGLLLNNLSLNENLDLVMDKHTYSNKIPKTNEVFSYAIDFKFSEEDLAKEDLCKYYNGFSDAPSNPQGLVKILKSMGMDNDLFKDLTSEESASEDDLEDPGWNITGSMEKENAYEEDFQGFAAPLQERINKITELDDYKFFSNPKISSWGGFDYWKKAQVPSNKHEKQPRKKKVYSELILGHNKDAGPEAFAPPKKGCQNFFTDGAVKKWEEGNFRMPEDHGQSLFRMTQLFTRPRTQVKYVKLPDDEVKNVIVEQGINSCSDDDEKKILFAEEMEYFRDSEEDVIKFSIKDS
jgi:Condensin complex subunit 2